MPETLRFHDGQAYLEASNESPFPVKVMRDVQSANIVGTTKQVAPVTTAVGTLIAAANPNRRSIMITNITGAQVVYVGFDAPPTSATGQYLHSSAGSSITIYAKNAVYGLSISAAQTLSVMEESYANA